MQNILPAFTDDEFQRAKLLLAARVAQMLGRKFEEGDWASVYCSAKDIPEVGWSNLNIDVIHEGLGVEHKMLGMEAGTPMSECCGRSFMHPSATRSIRIATTDCDPETAKDDILTQYAELIASRRRSVQETSPHGNVDLRTGWLIWERTLTEFLYFEEELKEPNPAQYVAEWNERTARGQRKGSKNLWIYDRETGVKRFSVTTDAGAKIQPYFDVPEFGHPSLYFFKVQGEELADETVRLWLTAETAREVSRTIGSLDTATVSDKIREMASSSEGLPALPAGTREEAVPLILEADAYQLLTAKWLAPSDELRVRKLLSAIIEGEL